MKYTNTIVAILAVFMVMMSAAAVFAGDDILADGEISDADDAGQTPVRPIADDVADDEGQEDGSDDASDDSQEDDEDDASEDDDEGDGEGEGEVTATGDDEAVSENVTAVPLDAQNQAVSSHATGNPILVLLAVLAVLGICPLRK